MLELLLLFGILLKVLDCTTTYWLVSAFSSTAEANPAVRFLIEEFGIKYSMTIIFCLAVFLFTTYYCIMKRYKRLGMSKQFKFAVWGFILMVLVHVYVVGNNLYYVIKYL